MFPILVLFPTKILNTNSFSEKRKKIWICDMACLRQASPQQANIAAERNEKVTKYRQLAFE